MLKKMQTFGEVSLGEVRHMTGTLVSFHLALPEAETVYSGSVCFGGGCTRGNSRSFARRGGGTHVLEPGITRGQREADPGRAGSCSGIHGRI